MDPDKNRVFQKALAHWPEAFAFALALTRERSDAEDLCQEAFLRLWAMNRPLDDTRPLRPLLFTIVKNEFRTRARRQRPDRLDDVLGRDDAGIEVADDGPAVRADRSEQVEIVHDALGRMNPIWRAALYLADGIGLSYAEIAEVLDRTEDVVRVTLHRARLRVRVLLKNQVAENAES